jgi:hypothetical protein
VIEKRLVRGHSDKTDRLKRGHLLQNPSPIVGYHPLGLKE